MHIITKEHIANVARAHWVYTNWELAEAVASFRKLPEAQQDGRTAIAASKIYNAGVERSWTRHDFDKLIAAY